MPFESDRGEGRSVLALLVAALLVQAPPLKPCLVQTVHARCGSVAVAENRAFPNRRTIRLRVVVIPSLRKPAAPDAFTFVAGGPGGAATELTSFVVDRFWRIRETRDIVLVDQRGTGGSNRLECPPPKAVRTKARRAPVRRIVPPLAPRRPDAVRNPGGGGRPRGGAACAGLPAARRLRRLVRRDRRADVPGALPAVDAHGRPRRRHGGRRAVLRAVRRQRPARARRRRRALLGRSLLHQGRSRAGERLHAARPAWDTKHRQQTADGQTDDRRRPRRHRPDRCC